MSSEAESASCCAVCGNDAVRVDDVLEEGWLRLAECPRCDHRWTARITPPLRLVTGRPARARRGEAVAAA